MIDGNTTVAQLRRIPFADAVRALVPEASHPVMVTEGAVSDFYRRAMVFERAGKIIPLHVHNYNHLLLLFAGSLTVEARQISAEAKVMSQRERNLFRAQQVLKGLTMRSPVNPFYSGELSFYQYSSRPMGAMIEIDRWYDHELVATEDNTFAVCMFVRRDFDGKPTGEPFNGYMEPFQ